MASHQHRYLIAAILGNILVCGQAFGGVNGDGKLDAVFANLFQTDRVCLGNGAGGFACSDVSADTGFTWDVGLGDVNGDGDLDIIFANCGMKFLHKA